MCRLVVRVFRMKLNAEESQWLGHVLGSDSGLVQDVALTMSTSWTETTMETPSYMKEEREGRAC